ncbi:MAG TPA: DNA-3-methyladenine glycosylase I [Euzebyales bacterium]|nr:DNA-3-methyladenine glycosylase I [Euzebyales bacterium]
MSSVITGDDGVARCAWSGSSADYVAYHDDEWGRPVHDDHRLFEKLSLEAFQSGLSWLTILRKRAAFRDVFADFDIATVAAFGDADIARLLEDARIVRNRAKIVAVIANARAAGDLLAQGGTLDALLWSFAPRTAVPPPRTLDDIPATTPESTAMARALKARGFRFVGPTTCYALMQAVGMVNDHVVDCAFRAPRVAAPAERPRTS